LSGMLAPRKFWSACARWRSMQRFCRLPSDLSSSDDIQTAVNVRYILQYYRIDVELNLVAQKYCDSPFKRNKSYCRSQYIVTRY
jgi:hypothetical protein